MWNSKKRLSALLVISLVACSLLLAFPGRGNIFAVEQPLEAQETPGELPVIVEDLPVLEEVLPVVENLDNSQDSISMQLFQMLTDYERESKLNKNELEKLIEKLEIIRDEYEIICQDLEVKELEIDKLADLNAEQADSLAYLRGAYDKETGVKAYANVGAVIGFKDKLPTWGLSSALGMRFGRGLMLGLGAQYMIGSFTSAPILDFSLDNLAITASIGWEW